MDSEGTNTINNRLFSRKYSTATTASDAAVNKARLRNIATKRVRGFDKINESDQNIENQTVNKTILKQNKQMVLIRPKLRRCPEGTVRDNNGECALKFSDN